MMHNIFIETTYGSVTRVNDEYSSSVRHLTKESHLQDHWSWTAWAIIALIAQIEGTFASDSEH